VTTADGAGSGVHTPQPGEKGLKSDVTTAASDLQRLAKGRRGFEGAQG
jgi:hypothetical protein